MNTLVFSFRSRQSWLGFWLILVIVTLSSGTYLLPEPPSQLRPVTATSPILRVQALTRK